jgi:hypothetical protein
MGHVSLKSSVFFSRFDGGVVFRGAETPVIFRGKRAHDLVKAIIDRMDAGVSKNDLLAQFPDPLRQAATQLLNDLEEKKLLRIRDADDSSTELTLHKQFLSLWNFLADRSQRPGEALLRWRETKFFILGPMRAGLYAARSLAECAAIRMILVVPEEEAVSRTAVEELCAEFPDASIEVIPESACARQGQREAHSTWIRACGDSEFTASVNELEGAWYFGLLAGHLVNAFVEGRLAEVLPQWRAAMRPALADGQGGRLADQRVALAAAALAYAMFSRSACIENDPEWFAPRIIGLDARILPVTPAVPAKIQPAIEVVNLGNGSARIAQTIDPDSEAIRALFDPITGILDEGDADVIQVPLSVVQLKVYAQDRGTKPSIVYGWGMNLQEARLKVIQRGVLEHLRTISEIAERAVLPAVEWSKQEAVENASALAEAAREIGANAEAYWETAVIQRPEGLKLYKLLELILAVRPHVEIARLAADHGARCRVSAHGELLAERCAASVDLALYEALGEACMRVQLADAGIPVPLLSFLHPCHGMAHGEARERVCWIDLGFPTLATQLYAAAVAPGAY